MRTRDPVKERNLRKRALDMVVRKGFDGFSMQKLARAAGVSPATIYIYFKDKEDLILKLHAEEMSKMAAYTLDGFDPAMRFAEGLRVQWLNRARYFMDHPVASEFLEQVRMSPLHERAKHSMDPA